jgi:hypothetical protein
VAIIKSYNTQWAAQFFAAAELSRRGYIVAPTLGNALATDLLAQSPRGITFAVEVKGRQTRGHWAVRRVRDPKNRKLYILVLVPTGQLTEPVRPKYFIMTEFEVQTAQRTHRRLLRKRGRLYMETFAGFKGRAADRYENHWQKLPK